jgi:hypothetical protein
MVLVAVVAINGEVDVSHVFGLVEPPIGIVVKIH